MRGAPLPAGLPVGVVSPSHLHMTPAPLAPSPVGAVSPGVTLNPVLRQSSYDTMFQNPYQEPPTYSQQQPPPPGHAYSQFHGAPPTNHGYVHQGTVPSMRQYVPPPNLQYTTSQSFGKYTQEHLSVHFHYISGTGLIVHIL